LERDQGIIFNNLKNKILKMDEIKYPIVYVLDIKRGVKWSERKLELHRDKIKYFNPSKCCVLTGRE
jgi:hypothetical protein